MALHKLISLLLRVTTLTLWVVAANALNLPPNMTSDSQASLLDDMMDVNLEEEGFEDEEGVAPVEQMIMVGCWLSMKEVRHLCHSLCYKPLLSYFKDVYLLSSSALCII